MSPIGKYLMKDDDEKLPTHDNEDYTNGAFKVEQKEIIFSQPPEIMRPVKSVQPWRPQVDRSITPDEIHISAQVIQPKE